MTVSREGPSYISEMGIRPPSLRHVARTVRAEAHSDSSIWPRCVRLLPVKDVDCAGKMHVAGTGLIDVIVKSSARVGETFEA